MPSKVRRHEGWERQMERTKMPENKSEITTGTRRFGGFFFFAIVEV